MSIAVGAGTAKVLVGLEMSSASATKCAASALVEKISRKVDERLRFKLAPIESTSISSTSIGCICGVGAGAAADGFGVGDD